MNMRDRAPLHRRRLGRVLRQLRDQAGMTQEEAGKLMGYSDSKISRFETGQKIELAVLKGFLDIYTVPAIDWKHYHDLWHLANTQGWWVQYKIADQGYVSLEDEAKSVRTFQMSFIPGLLQTETYARMLFDMSWTPHSRNWINTEVMVRLHRQLRLMGENALIYEAIIQESVLRRIDTDTAIMRDQLNRLIDRAQLPNVTIRVVPERIGPHDGLLGGLTLLQFPDKEDEDIVYLEHALGAEHINAVEQVRAAKVRLDRLAKFAYTPDESIELFERVMGEL